MATGRHVMKRIVFKVVLTTNAESFPLRSSNREEDNMEDAIRDVLQRFLPEIAVVDMKVEATSVTVGPFPADDGPRYITKDGYLWRDDR